MHCRSCHFEVEETVGAGTLCSVCYEAELSSKGLLDKTFVPADPKLEVWSNGTFDIWHIRGHFSVYDDEGHYYNTFDTYIEAWELASGLMRDYVESLKEETMVSVTIYLGEKEIPLECELPWKEDTDALIEDAICYFKEQGIALNRSQVASLIDIQPAE